METLASNETVMGFFQDLGIDASFTSGSLRSMAGVNSKYLRDLKLNVSGMLGSKNMTKKEAYMVALSVAINEKHDALTEAFTTLAKKEGSTDDEIGETHACVSIMNMNNIFLSLPPLHGRCGIL